MYMKPMTDGSCEFCGQRPNDPFRKLPDIGATGVEDFILTDNAEKRKLAKVGDPNYSSGHSVNADGYCNMGCC